MGTPACTQFLEKLKKFDYLIKYAARRYHISGCLDREDLYQEGLVILDGMFKKYDLDPNSVDFDKLFKTELWHGLRDVQRRWKASKRDYRKTDPCDFSDKFLRGSDLVDEHGKVFSSFVPCSSIQINPDTAMELQDSVTEVDQFIAVLSSRLDDDANVILIELLHPRTWEDIPEEYCTTSEEFQYTCRPCKVPQRIIASALGITHIKFRRIVRRIRKTAIEVSAELGLLEEFRLRMKTKRTRKKTVNNSVLRFLFNADLSSVVFND